MSCDRTFPVLFDTRTRRESEQMECPRAVPWALLAPHEPQALRNHDQDLETLACCGGLSPQEMIAVLEDRPWSQRSARTNRDAVRALKMILALARGPAQPNEEDHTSHCLARQRWGDGECECHVEHPDRGPAQYRPGEPCSHPGCMSHVTHPCEGCGRQWGQPRGPTERADFEEDVMAKRSRLPSLAEQRAKFGPSADRQGTEWAAITRRCKHRWQPVSMVFETQLLDDRGRVLVRQPDLTHGRCYLVCLKCCAHTYVETGWVGHYVGSPDLIEEGKRSPDLPGDQ